MIITYLRSSSYNGWDMCPHSYTLDYAIGMKSQANQKAIRGNMTHKALELLACKKLAMQNGDDTFRDEESGESFSTESLTPDQAIEFGYRHYAAKETAFAWDENDLEWCRGQMQTAMSFNNGLFNPLNRHVVMPEQYFDFEVNQPWANYCFKLPDGTFAKGKLRLKGTVDLIVRVSDSVLEYIDWKTGKRLDWATGEAKDWKKLSKDPQLRMYHYALSKLYPKVKHFIITIVFTQDGGPFSMNFGPQDLLATEAMLKKRFEEIRDCTRPPLKKSWKCTAFCYYGKNKMPGTNETICEHMRKEILTLGVERVTAKHGDQKSAFSYGDGGGQSNRGDKK